MSWQLSLILVFSVLASVCGFIVFVMEWRALKISRAQYRYRLNRKAVRDYKNL